MPGLALNLLALAGCGRPGGPPSANGDPEGAWPELPGLDEELVDRMERDRVAGLAACITRGGALLWCGGYGEANPDTGLLALPSTPFLVASVSKAVAALSVMQAVEAGVLDLDAPVAEVLPFPLVHPDEPEDAPTLRALMTHTAGIADNWDALEGHVVEGDSDEELGALLRGYLVEGGADYDARRNFVRAGVGERFEYSNVGAALAAYAVEAATGLAFDAYSEAGVLEPLGMNAGWHLADFNPDEVAAPCEVVGGAFQTVPHFGFPDYPDGQLRADARSLATLLATLAEGGSRDGLTLLQPATVEALFTPQVPSLDPDQGLLWYRWELDGEEVVGHNGGEVGTAAEILLRRRDGLGLVVLMNSEGRARTLESIERALMEAAASL